MATNNLSQFLTGVADAIRNKNGTTGKIDPQDFAEKIKSLGISDIEPLSYSISSSDEAISFDAITYSGGVILLLAFYPNNSPFALRVTLMGDETGYAEKSFTWGIYDDDSAILLMYLNGNGGGESAVYGVVYNSPNDTPSEAIYARNATGALIDTPESSNDIEIRGIFVPYKYYAP